MMHMQSISEEKFFSELENISKLKNSFDILAFCKNFKLVVNENVPIYYLLHEKYTHNVLKTYCNVNGQCFLVEICSYFKNEINPISIVFHINDYYYLPNFFLEYLKQHISKIRFGGFV